MSPHKKSSKGRKSASLDDYRAKRRPESTPEPVGGEGVERPGLFVVQQHAATALHYDLRLEAEGVLASWAVPKGPSLDPQEKRLAVATEDHPIEYADFEGVIPEGNYGAGSMIVWDRGRVVHHLDPVQGRQDGKLLFELYGYKLRGLWTLVKTSRNEKGWLLIKKPDGWARSEGEEGSELPATSVLSGLTVHELARGAERAETLAAEAEELGAEPDRVAVGDVRLMLAQTAPEAFSRKGWFFELKYDGYRLLAARQEGVPKLVSRNGIDLTGTFPEIARAVAALPFDHVVMDGEVTVLDGAGQPQFSELQRRGKLTKTREIERAEVERPATLFVFDLLSLDGLDLRGLPLRRRKELLRRVVPEAGPVLYADHVEERGEELYRMVRARELEGLMAKNAESLYVGGRSPQWLKIRSGKTDEFVVVGYGRKGGAGAPVSSLHLAALDDSDPEKPRWKYVGRVGTGWTGHQRRELAAELEPLARRRSVAGKPTSGTPRRDHENVWVDPRMVVEVRFTEWTGAGHLRHPVFVRVRDDKDPEECRLPHLRDGDGGEPMDEGHDPPEPVDEPEPAEAEPRLRVSRREKVFFPESGLTKGDLLDYYEAVWPWLEPYLADRPLILDRYPDGITGKSFFQKHAPNPVPDWVRTEGVWSKDESTETRFVIADRVETLLYLVNLGSIPFHVTASRVSAMTTPDWASLDLDAKDAPFDNVVKVARSIRRLTKEIAWPAYVKTSGATGMHVLLPLGGQATHEQARQLAELLARVVTAELSDIASVARLPHQRKGKVYVDFLQNGYGKLLVAPYSVRPRPGAPVSMPLTWGQVTRKLSPDRFTLVTAPRMIEKRGKDPLAPVLTRRPDLAAILEELSGIVAERLGE
jgi:bifunctional non-homologous end joining protein LigD